MTRRIGVSFSAAAVTLLSIVAASPAVAGQNYHRYVSLGDSFAAGTFAPWSAGAPCFRSSQNYAHQIERELRPAEFVDASCSGATTADMKHGQSYGMVPPQFDALTADTDLVTVHIGGNDLGLYGKTLVACGVIGVLGPLSPGCAQGFTAGGHDRLQEKIDSIAPRLAGVQEGIRQRSPYATILAVGAPDLLPTDGRHCWPTTFVAGRDIEYLNATTRSFNAMTSKVAKAHGASYVDTFQTSIGHDMCAALAKRWMEGMIPAHIGAPVHPNVAGAKNQAGQILATLRGSPGRA
ncbi:SGNH/GDSL hydrolase family protein [Sciscionella marina]|uniref:SGNH/GDSL hydrolase family protein n=1 Tax=Sciscionella marina TaxID=508770 RepID=UPI000476D772|nr:SGNH/GDSL hydrolase family protein [Sciscionella marina]